MQADQAEIGTRACDVERVQADPAEIGTRACGARRPAESARSLAGWNGQLMARGPQGTWTGAKANKRRPAN